MEKIAVQEISQAEAAAAIRAAKLDTGLAFDTPESLAGSGVCMRFVTEAGACVFVMEVSAGVLWISAAAANGGHGMTAAGLALAEATARHLECTHVAFQTARRGLVRLVEQDGFETVAYVLKKAIR